MKILIRPMRDTETAALTAVKAVALLVALSFLLTPLGRGREPRYAISGVRHTALPARITPRQTHSLHAPVAGRIKQLLVSAGDWVQAGEVIAILENSDLAAERERAELRLRITRQLTAAQNPAGDDPAAQELQSAQSQARAIEQQLAAYELAPYAEAHARAKATLARIEGLAQGQLATAAELENARRQEQSERRNLESVRTTRERLGAELAAARERLERAERQMVVTARRPGGEMAELNRDEAEATVRALEERERQLTIRATSPGRVAQLATAGETVPPGGLVAQVVDLSKLNFDVAVTSKVAQALAVGDPVEVIVPRDPPARVNARISAVLLAPEQQQPYIVRVTIDNPAPNEILAGLEGAVQFEHTRGSWLDQLMAARRER